MRGATGEKEVGACRGTAPPEKRASRARLAALAALLGLSELVYLSMLRLDAVNGPRPVLTFLGMLGALFALYAAGHSIVRKVRGRARAATLIVAAGAVLFRLTLLPAGLPHDAGWRGRLAVLRADARGEAVTYERFLLFDNDVWRYLWDGHVWAHGVNPYLHAPDDPALDTLAGGGAAGQRDGRGVWGDVRDNINFASTPTIYPPLAQGVFRLAHAVAPGSVLAMKGVVVAFDLLAVLLLTLTLKALGRPAPLVLLYAWNPLVVKVFAASGHVDAVAAAALAAAAYFAARGARRLLAVSFGLAVLAKLSPVVLLPFVVRRAEWRGAALACAVAAAGYLPFAGAGLKAFEGLRVFAREWEFNAGPYYLARWLAGWAGAGAAARTACGLLVLAFVVWLARRDDGRRETFFRSAALALGALVVLSPAVMPWYMTWVLVPALLANQKVWFYFSALVCLAFLVMVDEEERALVLWLEYGLLAALLLLETARAGRRGAATSSQTASAARAWIPRISI